MIPYSDLGQQHEDLREELRSAIDEVLDSRQFILGKHVQEFESRFSEYCGTQHAIAVNSGTSALHLALLAAGVGPGDEVITVPFTFAATTAAIYYCGARPVFVDIDPITFNMSPEGVSAAITSRTKAILPVHLFGQPADMDAIRRFGLPVIEDAAQAHGAEYKRKRTGGLGDLGCFSFYPTKNIGACGEAGIVTTNDSSLANTVRLLRDWGQDRKYHHAVRGYNYRMEGLQGAILLVKLRYAEKWTEARRKIAAQYHELLNGSKLTLPAAAPEVRHVYHTYTVRSGDRDVLQRKLADMGVGTAIHYPIPVHLQTAYADPQWPEGSLPESERAAREVLSLPIYPELTAEAIRTVADAVLTANHPDLLPA